LKGQVTITGWMFLASLADSSGVGRMSETIALDRASPAKLAAEFQEFFRAHGLSLEPAARSSGVLLSGPQGIRSFSRGKALIVAMDVEGRFLDSLRSRANEYDYSRSYSLDHLTDRVDRYLEGERALEQLRHWVHEPRSWMQGCGGEAWRDWYSRHRW
jgi:hypothetical protein